MDDECNGTGKETFQEPRKRFWLRSRKRAKSDAISVSSMDISIESEVGKKKKRRRITEVASSIFSSASVSKVGNTLHRSFVIQPGSSDLSFMEEETDTGTIRKKRKNSSDGIGTFTLRSWMLDVAKESIKDTSNGTLSRSEVKRQEAIYELYCGENVLLNDLHVLKDLYYEPLLSSGIFTSDELFTIFGDITRLIEIHSNLRDELIKLRDRLGFTDVVGPTILSWLPSLTKPYLERCKTQVWAKYLLDEKRLSNKRFQAFLKKRLESSHSIEMWTYLDVPRSRIVKYPLLVKEILRHTPPGHADQIALKEAYKMTTELLKEIDKTMGDAECKLAQFKINAKSDYDPMKCIENARELITEGQLKDARGMRFHCFLFDTCFAITRFTRRANKKYSLLFPVMHKDQICICNEEKDQNDLGFKIGDYFLITEDGHDKRHWIDSFNKIHRNSVDSHKELIENVEKENLPNLNNIQPKLDVAKRKSTSSACDNHFSFSLRKSLSKQKRNSIGYV